MPAAGAIVALAIVAAPSALAADSSPALFLELASTKHTILVDEPLVVTLVVAGRGEVFLSAGHLQIVIESPEGPRVYKRKQFVSTWEDPPRKTALSRKPLVRDWVLGFDGNTGQWAFPRAGRYRVTVVHNEPGLHETRSNTVTIEVREPEGAEAEAHEALQPFLAGDIAAAVNEQGTPPAVASLAARYPDSAYSYLPRVYDLYGRLHHAARGVDPFSEEPGRQGDVVDAARRQELARGYYRALRPLLADLADVRGPLQPDLLLRLADVDRALGDYAGQKAILRKVAHQFPRRPAGEHAARELKSLKNDEKIRRELDR